MVNAARSVRFAVHGAPGVAVVGYLNVIHLAVGRLPMQGDTAEAVQLAQVDGDPLSIGACTSPTASHIAIGYGLFAVAGALATGCGNGLALGNEIGRASCRERGWSRAVTG